MAIVAFRDVRKSYQMGLHTVEALRGVSFDVDEGEFLAIMGPSGSGKSTLLNLLGCLDRPTSGSYLLGDEDVSHLDDAALSDIRGTRIGFIFQSFNLIPQLSVLENIEVPLFYQGIAPHRSRERAMEMARLVGLENRVGHRPFELSGGQQQRVAIARALAGDPLILLADEPTGNLDSKTADEILDLLERLHQAGKTLILVTHEERLGRMAQSLLRVQDGLIESHERKSCVG
jgi:putative ABC transport system ATP-binding protein